MASPEKEKRNKIMELMFDLVWEQQIRSTSISDITTVPYTIDVPGDEYVHVLFDTDLDEQTRTLISDRWTTSAAQTALRNEIRAAKGRLDDLASGKTAITSLASAVPEIRFMARVVYRLVEQEETRLFPS